MNVFICFHHIPQDPVVESSNEVSAILTEVSWLCADEVQRVLPTWERFKRIKLCTPRGKQWKAMESNGREKFQLHSPLTSY